MVHKNSVEYIFFITLSVVGQVNGRVVGVAAVVAAGVAAGVLVTGGTIGKLGTVDVEECLVDVTGDGVGELAAVVVG